MSASAAAPSIDEAKYVKKESQTAAARQTMFLRVMTLFLLILCVIALSYRSSLLGIHQPRNNSNTLKGKGLPRPAVSAPRVRPALPGTAALPPPPPTEAEQAMAAAAAALAVVGPSSHDEEVQPPPTWIQSSPDTCNGFFGNGYSSPISLLLANGGGVGGGVLECSIHSALTAVFCSAKGAVLHPERVEMSKGGESMAEVMGRAESVEQPIFSNGALEIMSTGVSAFATMTTTAAAPTESPGIALESTLLESVNNKISQSDNFKAAMLSATRVISVKTPASQVCTSHITDPVFALTRMEYANLFHTTTDWYNVWSVARALGYEHITGPILSEFIAKGKTQLSATTVFTSLINSPKLPIHILFLDGHNAGPMDEGWLGLFASISYLKHFAGPVCFDNIVFAPFG